VGEKSTHNEDKPTLAAVLDYYGVNYYPNRRSQMIRCLFHQDSTPSMSINLNESVFNCHSCGNGGDALALLMEKEGLSYRDAREFVTTVGLATRDAGGSDGGVRGSRYASRSSVSAGPRDRQGSGGYVPAWRRR
jgi:hypothetical protein